MGHHTFDAADAEKLEDASSRYCFLSREELHWALNLTGSERVLDLGSGTGFYTDDVAPRAAHVCAVDLQHAMHAYYRTKGVPANTALVTAAAGALPLSSAQFDAAVATMTYHEFASERALAEVERVLAPGGRFVIADWSAAGTGEDGPPLEERFSPAEVTAALRSRDFAIDFRAARPETFLVVARRAAAEGPA